MFRVFLRSNPRFCRGRDCGSVALLSLPPLHRTTPTLVSSKHSPCRSFSPYNPRFRDIVVDHSVNDTASAVKFDIVGNKYKLKHNCSACDVPQEVEVIKLAFHRGCIVIKCPTCSNFDLFSDHMHFFKTDQYEKELSLFSSSIFVEQYDKFEDCNVIQITQLDFNKKKKKVISSRMAGFWEDSAWDDSKAIY
jgi:hypothetical protein